MPGVLDARLCNQLIFESLTASLTLEGVPVFIGNCIKKGVF